MHYLSCLCEKREKHVLVRYPNESSRYGDPTVVYEEHACFRVPKPRLTGTGQCAITGVSWDSPIQSTR